MGQGTDFGADGAVAAVDLVGVKVWKMDLVLDCSAMTIGIIPDFVPSDGVGGHDGLLWRGALQNFTE